MERECEEIQHKAALTQEEAARREQAAAAAEQRSTQLQQVRRCPHATEQSAQLVSIIPVLQHILYSLMLWNCCFCDVLCSDQVMNAGSRKAAGDIGCQGG